MSKIIETYKQLRNIIEVTNHNPLIGDLILSQENINLIKEGVKQGIVSDEIVSESKTYLSQNLKQSNLKGEITILQQTPVGLNDVYVSESEEKFFAQFNKYYKIPKQLYVHEIFAKEGFDEKDFINKLMFSIKIHEIILLISDYDKKTDGIYECFLYATKPLILKLFFSNYNFVEYNIKADKILEQIKSDFRSEIFISFLKLEIINLLQGVDDEIKFYNILSNFKTIYVNFNNSSLLYFKEFDFQKNKTEIQSSKIELLKKIHGVVNEINTKLITIPAAYLLILASLKLNHPVSMINAVYLFSALMYCLVIESSVSNQFFLLRTLKKDIEEFVNHDLKKGKLVKIFERYKIELEKSYCVQKIILWLIRVILWLLPISLIFILAYKWSCIKS